MAIKPAAASGFNAPFHRLTEVICFFLVALSGISFFFPTLQWLTQT
ncbi:hypothetical protein ACUOFC_48455, partial [Escherichia sp. TWPC-MK]